MARIFGISVGNETLSVGAERRGEITFTVTNNSSRPVRGRARVIPLGSTRSEWLKIAGEVERDFQAKETHQVAVQMEVPPGTAPGRYTFRLDVASTSNPEEEFTEGPIAAAEVAAPPAPKPGGFPWWIVAVAAVVVLIAGSALLYVLLRKVEVPPVVEKSVDEARRILEEKGFKVETSEQRSEDNRLKPGTVLDQSPEAHQKLKSGSVVKLIIQAEAPASGEPRGLVMPRLVNRSLNRAKGRLTFACTPVPCILADVIYEGSGSVPDGHVTRTNPVEGSPLRPGRRVVLYVSKIIQDNGAILLATQGLDLDEGTIEPASPRDVVFDQPAKSLRTELDARFLALGTRTDPDWCLKLPRLTETFDNISLASVSPGTCACVRTSDGNVAEIEILIFSSDEVVVQYRTWPSPNP